MSTSMTVLLELNWNDGKRTTNKPINDVAFDGILKTARIYDTNFPAIKQEHRYVFSLNIPLQEGILTRLIYWCEHGEYSYRLRWFFNEITS